MRGAARQLQAIPAPAAAAAWESWSGTASNSNRTISTTTAGQTVWARGLSRETGKWFFQLVLTNCGQVGDSTEKQGVIAVGSGTFTPASVYGRRNSTSSATIDVAVDIDAGSVWVSNGAGVWVTVSGSASGGDPSVGTSPTATFTPGSAVQPAAVIGRAAGKSDLGNCSVTSSFTVAELTRSPPSGYSAWVAA